LHYFRFSHIYIQVNKAEQGKEAEHRKFYIYQFHFKQNGYVTGHFSQGFDICNPVTSEKSFTLRVTIVRLFSSAVAANFITRSHESEYLYEKVILNQPGSPERCEAY